MGNALVQWLVLDSGSGIGLLRNGDVFLGKMLCEKNQKYLPSLKEKMVPVNRQNFVGKHTINKHPIHWGAVMLQTLWNLQ